MAKFKHRITSEIDRNITMLSSSLPPMAKVMPGGEPIYRNVQKKGSELKQSDLKKGTILMPDALYNVKQLVYENHKENMIHLFKRDGQKGVDSYVAAIRAQQEAAKIKMQKPSLWKRILNLFK
jgi:hypothetical protein